MLPASNRGVGMNFGFPDVCLTPAFPAPVPIPYPNFALNAQAAPFCVLVMITMVNALNMASKIPITFGDDAGTAHPMFKQMGTYVMGNPIVFIEKLPGITLLCPTTGNNMNDPVGVVLVPSAVNVLYTYRAPGAAEPVVSDPYGRSLDRDQLRALHASLEEGAPLCRGALLSEGVGHLVISRFTAELPTAVYNQVRSLEAEGMRSLILDLRGCPGGELDAAVRLAGDFLDQGAVIARTWDSDGDESVVEARSDDPYRFPLVVLVDGWTASAAELFAGAVQAHGRALLVGARTYGKGLAQAVLPAIEGPGAAYVTVARCALPDGTEIQGHGVRPDLEVAGEGLPTGELAADAQLHAAWMRAIEA